MRHRFGAFTLDEDTRQLLLDGQEVHLSPKAFDLLLMLLVNRTRAISKAELQQKLWPTTYVEETNLAGLVAQLRRALGDPADSPRFVRTVYGFGYRFVGDVQSDRAAPVAPSRFGPFSLMVMGRHVALLNGANTVGRSAESVIQIDAPGISRHHARITVSGQQVTLEDLGSKNGTHVNGRRVGVPCQLADGDRIQFGAVEATFRSGADMNATETLTRAPN